MVLYPASGDIMWAARVIPGSAVIDSSLHWFIADSEAEAGYLVALLNAPSLRRAFRMARGSGRNFVQNPWRKVPIPRFEPENRSHLGLATLTDECERLASNICSDHSDTGQLKLSNIIREQLTGHDLLNRIDLLVQQLLPEQTETVNTRA